MAYQNPPSFPFQRRQEETPQHLCCAGEEQPLLQKVEALLALLDHVEQQILQLPTDCQPPTLSQFVAPLPPHDQYLLASPFSSWSARSVKRFHLASFLRSVDNLREGLQCCGEWLRSHEHAPQHHKSTDAKGSTTQASESQHKMVECNSANTTNSNRMCDTPTAAIETQDTCDPTKCTSNKKRLPHSELCQDTVLLVERASFLLQEISSTNWISLTPHFCQVGRSLLQQFQHSDREETRMDDQIQSIVSLESHFEYRQK